jgi:RNA polymerase sigma-70 factor (ECF subfamily)
VKLELLSGARARTPEATADRAALVADARRGSTRALAAIYDAHHSRVRQLARRLLGDDAAAEDLVQEIFELLPRALRLFRGGSALETFLFAMVVNRTRQHLRGAIRRRRALERLTREPISPAASMDDDLHTRRRAAEIIAALDRLPLAQRVAFVLCEVQEMTSAEAAALVGAPEATIRTRVFHARRRLRALLPPERLP